MAQDWLLRKPKVMQLLIFMSGHERLSAEELEKAGFAAPALYRWLGSLSRMGLLSVGGEVANTRSGRRLHTTYSLSDRGKAVAVHLREVERLVPEK